MFTGAILLLAIPVALFFFAPTCIAYYNGKRHAHGFAAVNVLAAAIVVYDLFAIGNRWIQIPFPGALLSWLLLLGFALRKDKPLAATMDEVVEIVPYNASWPAIFEAEKKRLMEILEVRPADIEHIGSTAVPGLDAKPVIDMMLRVPTLERAEGLLSRLGILGYENFGEAGVPGRIYLRLRGERSINLHLVADAARHWTNNLALRDLLRGDGTLRERYAAANRAALAAGQDRLLAYSAAKQPVIDELLLLAAKR